MSQELKKFEELSISQKVQAALATVSSPAPMATILSIAGINEHVIQQPDLFREIVDLFKENGIETADQTRYQITPPDRAQAVLQALNVNVDTVHEAIGLDAMKANARLFDGLMDGSLSLNDL